MTSPRRRQIIRWTLILFATLMLHLLFVALNPNWFYFPRLQPPPVELTEVDPRALDRIKNQWKDQKSLLLADLDPKSDTKMQKNPKARFMSDRTRSVEKESRARNSDPVPATLGSKSQSTSQEPDSKASKIKLGDLGVRINLKNPKPAPQKKGADYAADQAILDDKLPVAHQNVLNTEESVYYSFYARIYQAIAPNWRRLIAEAPRKGRVPPGVYMTGIDLVLDKKGEIIATQLVQRSGVQALDQIAQDAIRILERFPNPPAELINAKGEVHTLWTFSLHVDSNSGFNWGAPEQQLE